MREIPKLTLETIKRMKDMSWFTHAKIFDDLIIVAQKETACYILKTSSGLVIIDGIWPSEKVYNELCKAINDAGWTTIPITKFIMTHGHIDHVGCGKLLVENHNVKTYLSKVDDELRLNSSCEEDYLESFKRFPIDCFLKDNDEINCGDKTIKVIHTPGHTDGTMSFVFPVTENDQIYYAALFGGATPFWNDEKAKITQIESIKKFKSTTKNLHVDVAFTNHTAFDSGLERIEYSKSRMKHLPNIYILGESGAQKFLDVFIKIANSKI